MTTKLAKAIKRAAAQAPATPHVHAFGRTLYAGSGGQVKRRCPCGATSYLLRYDDYRAVWGEAR